MFFIAGKYYDYIKFSLKVPKNWRNKKKKECVILQPRHLVDQQTKGTILVSVGEELHDKNLNSFNQANEKESMGINQAKCF